MIAIRCDQTGETWETITEAAIANEYSVTGFKKLVDEGRYTPDGLSFTRTALYKPKKPSPKDRRIRQLHRTIHDPRVMDGLNQLAAKLKNQGRL